MQCGCACTSCKLPISGERSTNETACNPTFGLESIDCLAYDESRCGAEWSTRTQVIWCGVPAPSTYPAMYDLRGGVKYRYKTEQNQTRPNDELDVAWTGGANATFVREAMAAFVVQPEPQSALADPAVVAGITVRASEMLPSLSA